MVVEEGHEGYKNSIVDDVATALGKALRYCAIVDGQRAGATASSEGTLSV